MKIGDIIRKARLDEGLSLTAVAEITGVSKSHISQTELGETKSPSFDVIAKLADFYGLSLDALYKASKNKATSAMVAAGTRMPHNLPIIPWSEIHNWQSYANNMGTGGDVVPSPFNCSEQSFAAYVTNDSMTATHGALDNFPEGALIIIDPKEPSNNKSFVVAFNENNNDPTFKQLIIDGSTTYLRPLNPQYPLQMTEKVTIVGTVLGYIKATK